MTRRAGDRFRELGTEPCPVCGHKGRCKANPSRDIVLCFRESSDAANGYRLIKRTGECATYIRFCSSADRGDSAAPKGGWQRKAENYRAALTPDGLSALAGQLHVTPEALKRIGVGWSKYLHAYTFPERDGQGHVVGITTRRPNDGAKKTLRGSKRGLIIPPGLDHAQPLLIPEGPSDVAAALSVDVQAVGRPSARGGVAHLCEFLADWTGEIIVIGERDQKADGTWPGRDGAIALATALAHRLGRTVAWALPPEGLKDLRDCVAHEAPDLRDAEACKSAGDRIFATLRASAEAVCPEEARSSAPSGEAKERGPSQSTMLVELVETAGVELFHDGDTAYATVPVGDHVETWPLKSKGFRRWVRRKFYREHDRTPSAQPLQDALGVLEGMALYDCPEHKVFVRIGHTTDALYLDLADSDWRLVEVKGNGWRVIPAADAPVRFRRPRGMLPLPRPDRGGSLSDLRPFVNVGSESDFILIVAWLIGALQPVGAYPVLGVNGEHGSAKTFLCRMLRRLIDRNEAELRSHSRDERDLVIAGNNGWVIALDNLSYLPQWFSDALCRIATGGGFATRQLYTDEEEVIFSGQRPIMLNGIDEVVTRPDLLDRSLVIKVPAIAENNRRPEAELWAKFEDARPRLLGALLTAVSAALRERRNVQLDRLPRMADFARWVAAAELGGGVPWEPGKFMAAYTGNRAEAVELSIEASPIGPTLFRWFEGRTEWLGTATELLNGLDKAADERAKKAKRWPKSGRGLSGALRQLAPALRALGIHVEWPERDAKKRNLRIRRSAAESSQPPRACTSVARGSENADPDANGSTPCDGRMTDDDGTTDRDRHIENTLSDSKNADHDGRDGHDGVLPIHSAADGATHPDPAKLDVVYGESGEVVDVVPARQLDDWGEL